jgi:hypothetical protein
LDFPSIPLLHAKIWISSKRDSVPMVNFSWPISYWRVFWSSFIREARSSFLTFKETLFRFLHFLLFFGDFWDIHSHFLWFFCKVREIWRFSK